MKERADAGDEITRENVVVIFVDLQEGHLPAIESIEPSQLRKNVAALAEICQIFEIPAIATAVEQPGPAGVVIPEISSLLGDDQYVWRKSVNAWKDPSLRRECERAGRSHLLFAGVALEVGISLPALSAVRDQFDVSIVIEAVGSGNPRIENATWVNLASRGVGICSLGSVVMPMVADFMSEEGRRVADILGRLTRENPFSSQERETV